MAVRQKRSKRNRTKGNLASGWELFKLSLNQFRDRPWTYLFIVAIPVVPATILSQSPTITANSSVSLYLNIASLLMTAALLWAVVEGVALDSFKLRQAYYDGARIITKLIILMIFFAIFLIPSFLGINIYSLGLSAGVNTNIGLQLLLVAIALVLSTPTVYLMVRYLFALFVITESEKWPLDALKASKSLTLGYFWYIFGRACQLIIWLALLLILPIALFIGLGILFNSVVFIIMLQILVSLISFPFVTIYSHNIYKQLKDRANG